MQVVAEPQAISKRVAAFGLSGSDLDVPMTVDEKEWPNALSCWRSDHVTGLAMAAVEAGHVQLTDRQDHEHYEALVDRARHQIAKRVAMYQEVAGRGA